MINFGYPRFSFHLGTDILIKILFSDFPLKFLRKEFMLNCHLLFVLPVIKRVNKILVEVLNVFTQSVFIDISFPLFVILNPCFYEIHPVLV